MKCLFINDDKELLETVESAIGENENLIYSECHSVADAMSAIDEHRPSVIFLDHSLTESGSEGLEIATRVKDTGIIIYSISMNKSVASKYQELGIEWIGIEIKKIKSIIGG